MVLPYNAAVLASHRGIPAYAGMTVERPHSPPFPLILNLLKDGKDGRGGRPHPLILNLLKDGKDGRGGRPHPLILNSLKDGKDGREGRREGR